MDKAFPTQLNTAVDTIENILSYAIRHRASDIHYDPSAQDSVVRLRVDGHVCFAGMVPFFISVIMGYMPKKLSTFYYLQTMYMYI
jgi:hypothetical protein